MWRRGVENRNFYDKFHSFDMTIDEKYNKEGRMKISSRPNSFCEIFLTDFENNVSRKTSLKFCEPIIL